MEKLKKSVIVKVFYDTKQKVEGKSHFGRMIEMLEDMGFNINQSRYYRLRKYYTDNTKYDF